MWLKSICIKALQLKIERHMHNWITYIIVMISRYVGAEWEKNEVSLFFNAFFFFFYKIQVCESATPLYSSYLAQCDFFLFLKLKIDFKEKI